jgi:hypothetical protein
MKSKTDEPSNAPINEGGKSKRDNRIMSRGN